MRNTISDTFKMRAQKRHWFKVYNELCIEFQECLFNENDSRSYKTLFLIYFKKVKYQQNGNPFAQDYLRDFIEYYGPKVEQFN